MFQVSLNNVLGQVRSLSTITHFFIIDLNFPGVVNEFYSSIFEYASFDILPHSLIYGEVFVFDDKPYSDQASAIGYDSRYIIPNSGTITIFFFVLLARTLFFGLMRKCIKTGCVGGYISSTNDSFLWSGALDYLNEAYLCICFSFCMNTSSPGIDSLSTAFNNFYALLLGAVLLFAPIIVVKKFVASTKPVKFSRNMLMLEGGEIEPQPPLRI